MTMMELDTIPKLDALVEKLDEEKGIIALRSPEVGLFYFDPASLNGITAVKKGYPLGELYLSEEEAYRIVAPFPGKIGEIHVLNGQDVDYWHTKMCEMEVDPELLKAAQEMKKVKGGVYPAMPGILSMYFVEEGETVQKGSKLALVEAMKMQTTIRSPYAGNVAEMYIKKGGEVQVNQPLMRIIQGGGKGGS